MFRALTLRSLPSVRSASRLPHVLLCLGATLLPLHAAAAPWMASGGSGHTQVLDGDGKLWGWGFNKYGVVGDGSTIEVSPHAQTTPREVSITDVISIASGQQHNLAVRSDGSVWSWGTAYHGLGVYEDRSVPVQVPGVANVKQVASGRFHTLALAHNGTVMAWGNNSRGAVGDGTTTHRPSPVALALSEVRAIAANGHSLALKSDGTVWGWGENDLGQAGGSAGVHVTTPTRIEGLNNIIAIAAGYDHSVALKSDGTVWTWGDGTARGDGTTSDSPTPVKAEIADVIAIAAGRAFTLALRGDGSVWSLGINEYVAGGGSFATVVPVQVQGLAQVSAIGAGMFDRMAIRADGTVFIWGHNDVGQLGNGQYGDPVNTPTRVIGPNNAAFALKEQATLKTDVDRLFNWAEAVYPQLFFPHTTSGVLRGYYARCYSTGRCVGEADGKVYLYDGTIREVGPLADLLNGRAIPAGF